MRLHSLFNILLGIAHVSLASVTISPLVLHERRSTTPYGWSLHRRADPDAIIPLTFALAQSNVERLEEYLLDIADPTSPSYGKHWSPAKVAATFRPSSETINTVRTWLINEGGVDPSRLRLSKDRGYLDLNVTVAEAEAMLATQYFVYKHEDGTRHVACEEGYHLPEHVSNHVDTVWPTVHFDVTPLSRRSADTAPGRAPAQARPLSQSDVSSLASMADTSDCASATTLDCLRGLYNFNYKLAVPDKHSIGIVEFGMETLNHADLDLFFQRYDPAQVGTRPTFVSIDGGISNQSITDFSLLAEPNLDFQYAMGLLGENATVLQYQVTNDGGPSFSYLQYDLLLNALDGDYCDFEGGNPPELPSEFNNTNQDCGGKPRANVVSISYDQVETAFGPFYSQRQCTEYGKLSLTGITFLVSSGDNGVATFNNFCANENGGFEIGGTTFSPHIGNTCPYVTSVGATQVKLGVQVTDPNPEMAAVTDFKTGGGFSNYFPRPSFQDAVVQSYIDQHTGNLSATAFNRSGRAYPDVAANGRNFQVYLDGSLWAVGGTSASAPTWAAMITAVNDARIAAGKAPVGWANPALYSDAFSDVFNDITKGDNNACGPDGDLGFRAAPGWDPLTGLGTPNFEKLLAAWMALP